MKTKEYICLIITAILIVVYFVGIKEMMLTKVSICILIVAVLISSYVATRFHIKRIPSDKDRVMRRLLIFYLLGYTYFLCSFTLGSQYFYRPSGFALTNPQEFSEYLKNRTNFIPFLTIIEAFTNGYSYSYIVINIAGNILALMPIGFFLPILYKRQRNFWVFFITSSLIVIFTEGLQMLFLMGSCDIDDFILNVFGAVIMFSIIKKPLVSKLIGKIFWEYDKCSYNGRSKVAR